CREGIPHLTALRGVAHVCRDVRPILPLVRALTPVFGSEEQRKARRPVKPAINVTGEDGGYAALGSPAPVRDSRRWTAVADVRLLLGIRNGTGKVVGIFQD